MVIEKAKKTIYGVLIVGLLIVSALLFGIVREYRSWQSYQQAIITAEEAVVSQEKRLQRLNLLKEQVPKIERQLAHLEEALPQHLDEQQLLNTIQMAALNPTSRILEINFRESISSTGYKEVPFQVVFEGQYQGLIQFLDNLEGGSRLFRIDELSIQESQLQSRIKANLKIASFCRD